ncbi:hypothetical protein D3C76_972170 [compost metagenome]
MELIMKHLRKYATGLSRYEVWSNGFIVDSVGRLPDDINRKYIELIDDNGSSHWVTRGEIVASEFIPKLHKEATVGYLDGNEDNAHVMNLFWNIPEPKPKRRKKNAKSKKRG